MSLVDEVGERLHSVRMGRMPESHKATLNTMVAAEVEAVLGQRPDLTVVKVADGARDNWTFLARALPDGVELIDCYHAAEHLKDAFDAAHGAHSPKAAAQFEKYRHLLRHEPDGVERVIRALVYGVEPTLVSPAAKFVRCRESTPAESSASRCRSVV